MPRRGLADHVERVYAALSTAPDHDLVADSWRRCVTQYDLDPEHSQPPAVLSSAEVREARGRAGRIARVSDPELDRLYELVASLGYAVLMTDAGGLVIASRFTQVDESAWRYWRLRTGAVWNEALEGTNGVGTCLADQHPITVHRDQHFRSRYLGLSCTAAPLFDAAGCHRDIEPIAGRLVCFLTPGREHAVLATRRDRLSISGWFRTRDSREV